MPVGNDIIDLNRHSARHRNQDERFIHKILHEKEIELMQQCSKPAYFLWLLWTVKEAAYKYCKQVDGNFIFSPKKITVLNSDFEQSFALSEKEEFVVTGFTGCMWHEVHTSHGILNGYSAFTNNYIHTVAVKNETGIRWGIKKTDAKTNTEQSDAVRDFLLKSVNNTAAELLFNEKIPTIKIGKKMHAASLSHDGGYISFAFDDEPN